MPTHTKPLNQSKGAGSAVNSSTQRYTPKLHVNAQKPLNQTKAAGSVVNIKTKIANQKYVQARESY